MLHREKRLDIRAGHVGGVCGYNGRVTSHHFGIQTWQTAVSHQVLNLMDTSPTTLFDTYEQDFNQLIESTRDKLEGSGKDEIGGMSFHSMT